MTIYKILYLILTVIKNIIITLTVLFFPIMIVLEAIIEQDYRWVYFMLSVLLMVIIVWCSISIYEFLESKVK